MFECNDNEEEYRKLVKKVLSKGEHRDDRTGVGTTAIFGAHITQDLRKGFPILSNKKMYLKTMRAELLWMLSGSKNIQFLKDNNVKIWDEWADPDGNVGPLYGYQWRNFGGAGVDQVAQLVKDIQSNPRGRRHLVTAWNPTDLPEMNLPPCHILWQVYVSNDGYLDLQYYQRSADVFLGLPYDICMYSMLMHVICGVTGLKPRKLHIALGDTHVYSNHLKQVKEYLGRSHLIITAPQFKVPAKASIDDYVMEDLKLSKYNPQGPIKAPVAI